MTVYNSADSVHTDITSGSGKKGGIDVQTER